jgi:hypothetical protein
MPCACETVDWMPCHCYVFFSWQTNHAQKYHPSKDITTPHHATPRYATPRHTTPHHTTRHHTTPHHTTPHHTTPHNTTPQRITPQHTTSHHAKAHSNVKPNSLQNENSVPEYVLKFRSENDSLFWHALVPQTVDVSFYINTFICVH